MNAHEDVENVGQDGWFVKAAGVIGDLGSPFYREERQREVWNEASAVGLQLVLWLGLAVVAAMVWLGGAPALPYAAAVFLILGAASWVTVLYALKLGIRLDDAARVLRLRLVPYGVLLVLVLVGTVRAAPTGGFGASFVRGAAAGGALAVLWLVWSGLRARRREQHGEV